MHRNDKATSLVGREDGAITSPSPAVWQGDRTDTDDVFGPNSVQKVALNDGVRPGKHGTSVEEVEGDQWVDTDLEGSEGGGDWDLQLNTGQNIGLHVTGIEQ